MSNNNLSHQDLKKRDVFSLLLLLLGLGVLHHYRIPNLEMQFVAKQLQKIGQNFINKSTLKALY